MRIIGLMIFISFSLQAEVVVNPQLNSLIQSFGVSNPNVIIPFCNCSVDGVNAARPEDQFENDQNQLGLQKVSCPNPWNDRAFYREINTKYCASRFGEKGFTCVEDDKLKIEARLTNANLMNKIETFTIKRFSDYKEKLITQCCAEKSQCRNRFQAVKLKIDPASSSDARYESDSNPSATSQNNTIVITRGKLASAYNEENVERVLMHELGHACQFALISEDKTDYNTFTSANTRCDQAAGLLMLREALGKEVSQCLIDELETQMLEIPEEQKQNYCFGKWYREAFADLKFRSAYTSPYHWTYDMGRRSIQKNYGSVSKYIRCAFPADWKKQLCL